MDNGESPGSQEDSSASTCSQSRGLGRAGMEINGGTRSTVCGLRTMEPENNLMVFERGSLARTKTGAPNVICLFIHAIWCAEKLILLFFIIFSSSQKHVDKSHVNQEFPALCWTLFLSIQPRVYFFLIVATNFFLQPWFAIQTSGFSKST